jgi:Uma2 family endonuclease
MTASLSVTAKVARDSILTWRPATWEEYLTARDAAPDRVKLFFNDGYLLVDDVGGEGINHSKVCDLFVMILAFWFAAKPAQIAESLGRCLLEKPQQRACVPDLVLYVDDGIPQWNEGEPRRIDLTQWRVPDLVGEIADTTLASDLDEKKHLYAALGIPEYWVIDVLGKRVIAFRLQESGKYLQCVESIALTGLSIELLEQTLDRLTKGTNITAANWFAQQISSLQNS